MMMVPSPLASLLIMTALAASAFPSPGASSSSSSSSLWSPSHWTAQLLGAVLLCPPDTVERCLPMMAPFPRDVDEFNYRKWVDRVLYESYREDEDCGYHVQWGDEWIVNHQNGYHQWGIMDDDAMVAGEEVDVKGDGATTFAAGKTLSLTSSSKDGGTASVMKPSTYGEITSVGVRQLMGAMGLTSSPYHRPEESDVVDDCPTAIHFFDLGSGAGKLVCQMALELAAHAGSDDSRLPRPTVTTTGVELSPSRHEAAVRAKEALLSRLHTEQRMGGRQPSLSPPWSVVELVHHNFLEADLSTATHVYVASLCFPPALMEALEDKLVRHAPRLQCVATLQRFPNDLSSTPVPTPLDGKDRPPPSRRSHLPTSHYVEMSWTAPFGCAVHVYHL